MLTIITLYEDDYLLAVDKPANLVCHETVDPNRPNLLSYLPPNLHLLHRLDKDTSGVILLAKGRENAAKFSSLFSDKQVEKRYLAIVEGNELKSQSIKNHLGPVKGRKNMHGVVKSGGKLAETKINIVKTSKNHSLVEAIPLTGRTHQIRVHLSELGCPIVGDEKYGASFRKYATRTFLHASRLTFHHSLYESKINIEAPIPEDFQRVLEITGLS